MAMTYYMSAISLIVQYLTNLGVMAQGGSLSTYEAGTSTPQTTYTDSTGVAQNPNPMTLSAAGRPQSTSGAPVAFWVPGGTPVKLIVQDASGNQLVYLDNVPAINDLTGTTTTLQNLLASASSSNQSGSGPVAGADLVANAVKSYDLIADVRAANAPTLVTGQTLSVEVQGGTSVGDGLGGFFYWSPSSGATDDGRTVLRPTSVSTGSAGRWLRYYPLGVPQVIVKTVDQSVTSNTSLQNDSTLWASLAGNAKYLLSMRLSLLGVATTTQGYKVGLGFTGTVTEGGAGGGVASSNGTAAAIALAIGGSALAESAIGDATPDFCNIDLLVSTGTAGTFQVQFAQDSSSANGTTMQAGSSLTVTRLA